MLSNQTSELLNHTTLLWTSIQSLGLIGGTWDLLQSRPSHLGLKTRSDRWDYSQTLFHLGISTVVINTRNLSIHVTSIPGLHLWGGLCHHPQLTLPGVYPPMALLFTWSQERSQVLSLVRQTLCLPSHLLSTLVPISNHSRLYYNHIFGLHTRAVYTTPPMQNGRASVICPAQTEWSYISGHPLNFPPFKQETWAPQHTKL